MAARAGSVARKVTSPRTAPSLTNASSASRRDTSPTSASCPTPASSARRRDTWPRTVSSPTLAGNARRKDTWPGTASSRTSAVTAGRRMLDMGFMPDIERAVGHDSIPAKGERQTLMFSATFPDEIQKTAQDFLTESYLFLTVGVVGGACADVVQEFHEVTKFEKREKLTEILQSCDPKDKTLVFVQTKKNADFIATHLSGEGLPTTSIHGDRFQREREEALYDFRTGAMPILVATAVAARGLDIKGVAHVVNFDMPEDIDEYVHRIGRTGRVGNVGKATSFYDSEENSGIAGALLKILSECGQEVPEWLAEAAANARADGGSGGGDDGAAGGDDDEDWG